LTTWAQNSQAIGGWAAAARPNIIGTIAGAAWNPSGVAEGVTDAYIVPRWYCSRVLIV
jgi:hypothetical protein